jgi:hypothetical protein
VVTLVRRDRSHSRLTAMNRNERLEVHSLKAEQCSPVFMPLSAPRQRRSVAHGLETASLPRSLRDTKIVMNTL